MHKPIGFDFLPVTRFALLIAMALLLAGCSEMPFSPASENAPAERQTIQLLNYMQRVAAMPAEQQRGEYNAGDRAFSKKGDDVDRMRLALLLALPGTRFHDPRRAAILLEPVASAGAPDALHTLAKLLYGQLNELLSEQKRAGDMRGQLDALKAVERTILERGSDGTPRRR